MNKWIPITKQEPPKEHESDVNTNCTCAIKKKVVVADAVYYHAEKKFFHNQDTSHGYPIKATHWMFLTPPK